MYTQLLLIVEFGRGRRLLLELDEHSATAFFHLEPQQRSKLGCAQESNDQASGYPKQLQHGDEL